MLSPLSKLAASVRVFARWAAAAVLIVVSLLSVAQNGYPKVHVQLLPRSDNGQAETLKAAIAALQKPQAHSIDSLLAEQLTRNYIGRAEVTLIWEDKMEAYTYASAKPTLGKSIAVLAVRDQSTLDFQHHTELRAFWRDTVVVIDSLSLNMARLPGAKPGTVLLADLSEDMGKVAFDFPSTKRPDALSPVFVLSLPGIGAALSDSTATHRLRLTCTANKDLSGDATFLFLGAAEKQQLLDLATMLHGEIGLRRSALVEHVEAYLRLWYGAPVRGNVQEVLRAGNLMNE